MGCPGCLLSEIELQAALQKTEKEAKQHAINDQKLYILYLLSDGRPAYMEAEAARSAGIQPIKYVSHLQ
jgi:hypothetical protein